MLILASEPYPFHVFLQFLPVAPLVLEERPWQLVVVTWEAGERRPVTRAGGTSAREPMGMLK